MPISASLAIVVLGLLAVLRGPVPALAQADDLGGTSWQLVKFMGGDDKTLVPDDRSKYTIAFASSGDVNLRIDCNRGHGTWKSAGPNQLEFGPMALTRAMCPAAPLNDRLAKDWQSVRSYILKDGHLFLSLMADAGTYEFEPIANAGTEATEVKGTATYRERMALPQNAVFEATLEDVSKADAAAVVLGRVRIDHPRNPPIAFKIAYDPAKIEANHSYAVRCRITLADQILFTSTENHPVLTRGHGKQVKLLLRKSGSSSAKQPSAESTIGGLPATFVGTLPCADCPGILYQVNLFPDHTFSSRMTYQERSSKSDEHGKWQVTDDGKTLLLQGEHGAPEKFVMPSADALRKLDAEGNPINSSLNYDLKRAATFAPIESGASGSSAGSLENTYWKLTQLGNTPVSASSGHQEPHFVLNSETHRVGGSGGCNRLTGSYELDGDHVTFDQVAGTMMACLKGMDTEKTFLTALTQAKTWKITGQTLELFDSSGDAVARFDARHMK